jgi:uncharacterized repeat protein (TIGR03803 family)
MTTFISRQMSCALLVFCFSTAIISQAKTTFKTLVSFDGTNGLAPGGTLVQGTDGNLYGTTSGGGKNGGGTVFKMTTAGKVTTLYSFCSKAKCADGNSPEAGLLLATNGNFYGTTKFGGVGPCVIGTATGCGTIFEITPEGKLTTLYTFCKEGGECSDGAEPEAPLIEGTNGDFYGTTFYGGNSNGAGTLFEITPAGELTTLYTFCSKAGQNCPDGSNPNGAILGTDGNLYVTTQGGGGVSSSSAKNLKDCGGIADFFAAPYYGIRRLLYDFCKAYGPAESVGVFYQFFPEKALSEPQSQTLTFYGAASGGGINAAGAIYSLTSGKNLTVVYDFCSKAKCADGAYPVAGVIEGTDGNFYGTTAGGNGNSKCPSLNGCGTVFELTPGGKLTTLHSFAGSDGENPRSTLVQATNGIFYGTTFFGRASGDGSIFSLSTGLGPFVRTVPTMGAVGSTVMILGTDLTGASAVSFNGKAAAYKVVSATEITATVPSDATTGTIEVTTPGGKLESWPFQVL